MLAFIVISYLLSAIGYGIYYCFLKNKVVHSTQKYILYFVIAACFIMPLSAHYYLNWQAPQQATLVEESFVEVCDNFCPSEEEISHCFDVAMTTDDFCNCAKVTKESLVVYHSNNYYNFLMYNSHNLQSAFIIAGVLLMALLLLKIFALNYIIFTSKKSPIVVDDVAYTLLQPSINLPVASFRLINKYIIWEDGLNKLSEQERRAILHHEIAHIKNYDTWWKIVEHLLFSVWLLNPVFYFIKKDFLRLTEFLADEYAVEKTGSPKVYANLLLKLKQQRSLALVNNYRATSGKNLLKERICNILIQPQQKKYNISIGVMAMASVYFLISLGTFNFIQNEVQKLEVYETLSNQHNSTGNTVFCKHCLSKNH